MRCKLNWYNKIIKLAAIKYLYHGTSINNLSSVLSEGLNVSHGKVYDDIFQNTDKTRSVESYEGTYFTDNLRTALMAGFTAAEKNKVKTQKSVVVIAQLEDKTPSVLIDEDLLISPHFAIYQVAGDPGYPIRMAEWISSGFPNIEQAVDYYINNLSNNRGSKVEDQKFLEGLKPYVPELLKTYAIRQLSIAINKEDWGTSTLLYNYPELKNLPEMGTAVQNYRNAANLFMQKAKRLTEFMNDNFQNNIRIIEPISYRGKNKIVLVSTFNRENRKSDYNYKIEILYMSNENVVQQYINDIKTKYSDNFLITYRGNIIYKSKKEGALV